MNWMKLLELVFGKSITKIPDPYTESITGDEVRILLSKYTDKLWISDGLFKLMSTQSLEAFLASDSISNRPYITEKHDCDDYSYELMGHVSDWNSDNTFGIVWGLNGDGNAHAWNFYIDEKRVVKFVEPQNDIIFEPNNEKVWMMIV